MVLSPLESWEGGILHLYQKVMGQGDRSRETDVEFPLFLFFPIVMSMPKMATYNTCPSSSRMLVCKTRKKHINILVFLSETVMILNPLQIYLLISATNKFKCSLKAWCDGLGELRCICSIYCT